MVVVFVSMLPVDVVQKIILAELHVQECVFGPGMVQSIIQEITNIAIRSCSLVQTVR